MQIYTVHIDGRKPFYLTFIIVLGTEDKHIKVCLFPWLFFLLFPGKSAKRPKLASQDNLFCGGILREFSPNVRPNDTDIQSIAQVWMYIFSALEIWGESEN